MQRGVLDSSQEQKKGVGEEKLFLTALRSLAGLKNYTDIRLLAGEKYVNFTKFLPCIWGPSQENEDLKK